MEAPLLICTKGEMRGVIRFLFAEGIKPVEIIRRMQAEYGDNCLSRSKIYKWIDHFKSVKSSISDEERSGRPSTSRNENNIQAVERMVRKTDESQWMTLRRLPYLWPNERSSKRKKISIRRRSHWSGAKLIKHATKKLFSDGIKNL
jgi:transposase